MEEQCTHDLRRDPHKGKQAKHAQLALPHELDERANCWRKGGQQERVHRGEMIARSHHAIDEIGDERRIDQGEEKPRPDRAPRQGWLIGGLHVGHRISFAFFSEGLSVGWDCAPGEYPPCGTEWRPSMSGASGYKIVPREWPRRRYRRP